MSPKKLNSNIPKEQSLSNALNQFMQQSGLQGRLSAQAVLDNWATVAGKAIAAHTKTVYFKDKTLYLTLDNPQWKQELIYSKTKLIDAINQYAGLEVCEDVLIF